MTQAIAYLAFDGTCADAMRFYEDALGGKLEVLLAGKDSPMKDLCAPGTGDRILHARLRLPGGGVLYAGDCPVDAGYTGIHGVAIALDYDTVAEATRVFDRLAAGGQVGMPMQPTFWAKSWGMCTDRFGTPWIVNGEMQPF